MGHFSDVHRFSMMMTVFFCSWQAERRQGTNAQNIQTYSNAMNRVLLAAELKIKNHAGTYMNRWDFFFFFYVNMLIMIFQVLELCRKLAN